MFGIRFIKVEPTTYLLLYSGGRIKREGLGLSFFYFAPSTSLVAIPQGSVDVPFIFEEITADYQTVTIQGQVTYRVADAKRLAALMNFTVDALGRHTSDDPKKLAQRVVNVVKVMARAEIERLLLREALRAADSMVEVVRGQIAGSMELSLLGVQILGLSILTIKPTPETGRALEAETRERFLREADDATYDRRNAAVEQERTIKENELNTEIAVEHKKRQIREAQMDAEKAVQERQHGLEQAAMVASIELENKRRQLVELAAANSRIEAEARAHGVAATMKAVGEVDPRVLHALASVGMKPEQLIAAAFQGLAEKADKIGELNISPDLLRDLMSRRG